MNFILKWKNTAAIVGHVAFAPLPDDYKLEIFLIYPQQDNRSTIEIKL